MMKQPKAKKDKEKVVVLERQYGAYKAKICFAAEEHTDAPQAVLDAIMQAYRLRMKRANL